jgi:hypothetical protein
MFFAKMHSGIFLKNDSFMIAFFAFDCHLNPFFYELLKIT